MRLPWLLPLTAVALLPLAACGSDERGPEAAGSCEELVEAAAATTREVLAEVADLTVAELASADSADPFAALLEPYDGFEERAAELGCGAAELERLACGAYEELAAEARGEVAEAFLADYYAACD